MVAVRTQTKSRIKKSPRQNPPLKVSLKLLEQKRSKSGLRNRIIVLGAFAVGLIVLFFVAFAQAKLVSYQQDLDLITNRITELQDEKIELESLVSQASSPNKIVNRAEKLGMVRAASPIQIELKDQSGLNG